MRDVMINGPYSVQEDHPLVIASRLMDDKSIRHLPVFRQKKLVGVLGERDLQNAIAADPTKHGTVATATVAVPLVASPEELVSDVVRRMADARSDLVCVLDRDRLLGIFTTIDALEVLAKLLEPESTASKP